MTDERDQEGSEQADGRRASPSGAPVSRHETIEADAFVEEVAEDEMVDESAFGDPEVDTGATTEPYHGGRPPPLPPKRVLTGRTAAVGAVVVILAVVLAVMAGQWLAPPESPAAARPQSERPGSPESAAATPEPAEPGTAIAPDTDPGGEDEGTVLLDPVVIGSESAGEEADSE